MIQHTISGTVFRSGGQRVNIPIEVELAYDEENDPLAVQMIFKDVNGEEEVCWVMGRELVMRGSVSRMPYGAGDVRFRFDPLSGDVLVCLKTDEAHADVSLDRDGLIRFLNATQDACKLGDEPLDDLIDQELKELLEG
jgi:hypothetical protein